MQDNTITLQVDVANNGTLVGLSYDRHEEHLNRTRYITPFHSLELRDTLDMYRTPPKKQGNYKGVSKTAFKFTRDQVVPAVDGTDYTSPLIIEVSGSVPIGTSPEAKLAIRQRAIAMLDDDAIMDALWDTQSI